MADKVAGKPKKRATRKCCRTRVDFTSPKRKLWRAYAALFPVAFQELVAAQVLRTSPDLAKVAKQADAAARAAAKVLIATHDELVGKATPYY